MLFLTPITNKKPFHPGQVARLLYINTSRVHTNKFCFVQMHSCETNLFSYYQDSFIFCFVFQHGSFVEKSECCEVESAH